MGVKTTISLRMTTLAVKIHFLFSMRVVVMTHVMIRITIYWYLVVALLLGMYVHYIAFDISQRVN